MKLNFGKSFAALGVILTSGLTLTAHATDNTIKSFKRNLRDVQIREQVTVDINLQVYLKKHCWGRGETLLAVHGLGHTATTYEKMAHDLINKNKKCEGVTQVIAMDLPGHGLSSGPKNKNPNLTPVLYGDLALEDYATALNNTIDRLRHFRAQPKALIGHSMGGVITQMAQQQLIQKKSSLGRKGIKNVYLLASSMPLPLAWQFPDSGAAGQAAAQYIKFDPALGTYLEVDTFNWLGLFFTNFSQQFVAGTPTPLEVSENNYISREPFVAGAQLLRVPGFPTPVISAGIFSPRYQTRLTMISAEQDITVQVSEQKNLYQHLTGDDQLKRWNLIPGDQAIHDIYITNPSAVSAFIK